MFIASAIFVTLIRWTWVMLSSVVVVFCNFSVRRYRSWCFKIILVSYFHSTFQPSWTIINWNHEVKAHDSLKCLFYFSGIFKCNILYFERKLRTNVMHDRQTNSTHGTRRNIVYSRMSWLRFVWEKLLSFYQVVVLPLDSNSLVGCMVPARVGWVWEFETSIKNRVLVPLWTFV